jgi:hypothetical protein
MVTTVVEKSMWPLILLVFCMLFYVDTIAIIAENRIIIISIFNDNIF